MLSLNIIVLASSQKQQSTCRHVAPLRTHYPDSEQISLCSFSLTLCAYGEATNTNFIVFGLMLSDLNSWSTELVTSTITITTPQMWFLFRLKKIKLSCKGKLVNISFKHWWLKANCKVLKAWQTSKEFDFAH